MVAVERKEMSKVRGGVRVMVLGAPADGCLNK